MPHIPTELIDKLIAAAMARLEAQQVVAHVDPASKVVAASQNLTDLIQKAAVAAPDLAEKFTGKSLIASKTPWGTIAGTLVGMAAAKYGLMCSATAAAVAGCWTQETVTIVGGGIVLFFTLVGAYVMRYLSPLPVTGILTPATPAQAAAIVTKGTTS